MIDFNILLEVCAGISIIGGACAYAGKLFKKLSAPLENLEKRLDHHDECLAKDKKRLDELEGQLKTNNSSTNLLLKAMMTILAHLETNNNTNEMKQMRKDIENYLIDR